MKDLKKYYGKKLVYMITELKNGKIETRQEVKTVYNPLDFKNCHVRPADGCDIVIGNNSTDSKHIFDVGGISGSLSGFTYGRFDSITLFNYCEVNQVDQVISEHKKAIKKALNEFIKSEQKRVNDTKEILKNI